MENVRTFKVFSIHPDAAGEITRHLAGRFTIVDHDLFVLEDYYGLLKRLPDGPVTPETQKALDNLNSSQYLDIAAEDDIEAGHRMDLLPELGEPADTTSQQMPQPTFEYIRAGMDTPQIVEFVNGSALMNGLPLTSEELRLMVQNVETGVASLRYRNRVSDPINKSMTFEELRKGDGSEEQLHGLMQKLKGLSAAGHVSPEEMKLLHHHLYEDHMVPGIGNKRAYTDFLSRPRDGVHIALDGNDLKSTNDALGHAAGDEAIKHIGRSMRAAMDEVAPGKSFLARIGGDEFAAHVPTAEHAHAFARALRSKLEGIAPLGGTHKVGVSLGMGPTSDTADFALNHHAKGAKMDAVAKITGVRGSRQAVRAPHVMYAHSLIPGQEGAIPQSPEAPPKLPAPKASEIKPSVPAAPSPTASPQPAMSKSEE